MDHRPCGSRRVLIRCFLEPRIPKSIVKSDEPAGPTNTAVCEVVKDDMKTGQAHCSRRRTPGFRQGGCARGRRSGEMLGRVAAALPSRTSEEIIWFVSKAVWVSWVGSIPPAAESLSCCHAPTGKVGA